ncbi:MAG: transporter substrate-binding protein [Betaproteobacteria bacterium]|nr:transporter substrate-binding protein [Betaproteobacteria bacterium]
MSARGIRNKFSKYATAVIAVAVCAGPATAAEPNYPVKPIRMIIANVAGGTSDILARVIGARLTESWGQQIIVDNRPGGSGLIGNELLVKAPPDGYTLLLADFGSTTTTALMQGKATIDLQRDYSPVTIVSYSPHLFCVHPTMPASNVKAVIALAKSKPGKLNFATAGQTTAPHWAGILLASRMGIDWTYIPGKGGAQAVLDVASGQADVLFNGMLATLPYVKSGKLKLIAVTSAQRNAALPDAPTFAESGVADFVTGSWQGILAPGKTPPEIVAKLYAETRRVLLLSDIKEKLAGQGADAMGTTPADTVEFMRRERERMTKLIRDSAGKNL